MLCKDFGRTVSSLPLPELHPVPAMQFQNPMQLHLPLSLLILLLQFSTPVWSAASLIPPSTFPSVSGASTSSSGSVSVTGTRTVPASASFSASGSLSASLSSSTTSSAQFPSLSGVSSCVSNCLADAIARVNCTSVVDVNCFCPKSNFSPELVDCILANCPDQVPTSESIAQQFCNVASTSVSLSFPSIPATSSTPSSTSSSSTASSSASTSTAPATTSSSAALRHGALDVSYMSIVSLGISLLAVTLGVAVVL